ncbi:MAG: hypothetical protein WC644_11865 [Ignavibacteria bacterium]
MSVSSGVNNAYLKLTTADELNSKRFRLERSLSGGAYEFISIIKG